MFHDTHVHLDLLFEQLGYLPGRSKLESEMKLELEWELNLEKNLTSQKTLSLSEEARNYLDDLLKNHNLCIHSTVSTKNAETVLQLFGDNPKIKILAGAHPEIVDEKFDVTNFIEEQNVFLKRYNALVKEKIIGIGECGLDYYYTQDTEVINLQKKLFKSQIQQALKHNLPLIIHCREAFADLFDILDEYPDIFGNFLIHCFTGNKSDLAEIIKRKGLIGLGGICTFNKSQNLQEAVKLCPDDTFVLETDLPFLSPTPMRGKTCLPEYINFTAQKIAEIKADNLQNLQKNETEQTKDIWKFSSQNLEKLFKLKL